MRLHLKIEAFEARLAFDEDLDDVEATGIPEEVEHDEECECLVCEVPRLRASLRSAQESRALIREALEKAEDTLGETKRELRLERERLQAWKRDADKADRQTMDSRLANGVALNGLREENAKLKAELAAAKRATNLAELAADVGAIQNGGPV